MLRIAAILSLAAASACGDDRCAEAMTSSDSAPVIEELELINQLASDPWTLIFAAAFTDSDGDLGGGAARLHLNGEPSGESLELFEIFRSSGLPKSARSGRIAFPLRFSDTVDDGAEVWLGLQLLDAQQQRSNCAALRLHFDVE